MIFIDTNYFLRLLLNDVPEQTKTVRDFIEGASKNKSKLFTSVLVLFEVNWVLTSQYQQTKVQVIEAIDNILEIKIISLAKRHVLEKALKIYKEKKLSLEDCYHLAYAIEQDAKEFKTFDKKLEKEFKKLASS